MSQILLYNQSHDTVDDPIFNSITSSSEFQSQSNSMPSDLISSHHPCFTFFNTVLWWLDLQAHLHVFIPIHPGKRLHATDEKYIDFSLKRKS